ncbi:hypothetical protein [Oleiagrimonas sp. MCCC 1A03011]|uniref:PD-(D/E)XK nuclease domain-containing protein n=1 Tax=Oleiagrimonas sp. MCCC 1A03011 TaxID=1926883 RepID=UPI0011BDB9FD|nr:hypothetical protein [Oleiagrimonas sp. MCCC 1A03011]
MNIPARLTSLHRLTSLADSVASTRRAYLLALTTTISFAVFIAAFYLKLVYPIFLPADMSNPAVQRLIASKDFQATTHPFFTRLKKFNSRQPGETPPFPDDLFVSDESQIGVTVNFHYKLVPQDANWLPKTINGSHPSLRQYRYDQEITVRPTPWLLITMAMIECLYFGLFLLSYVQWSKSKARTLEKGVLRAYRDASIEATLMPPPPKPSLNTIHNLLYHFHHFYKHLRQRSRGRIGFDSDDEFDLQDALEAALHLHFTDVKREETTPSWAGSSTRIDFLVPEAEAAIEVKRVRPDHREKSLANELLLDIARYPTHPGCTHLFFLIYDPDERLTNPQGLQTDIESTASTLKVHVVVVPRR